MENSNYDNYASMALQALISKTPLLDNKGEIGIKKTDDEMQEIKKELCRTAHSYASWMIQTRKEFSDYLKTIDIII
ncbi:hypothetical protein [uncultured Clostridium sp.]|uniref:hypothetical protein n=1 Tax=uncultured Clostridium sp. TaxID=59620 RepID=UPI002629A946|nr:hypothetical protein [uncultured Clostridium sp.]